MKMHTTIREQNELIVLTEIINHPEISRAEISKNTGVNKATISEIVRNLINDKLVIETGTGDSSTAGGRKPILLKINKYAGVSLSFDIRYDKISYFASYIDGEAILLSSKAMDINKDNIIPVIKTIVENFARTNEQVKETAFGLIGVAFAIHGIISENKIIFTPYYDLDQMDLAHELTKELEIPVYIENEANLAALAEASMDNIHDNLITCSIHTGVGAGIIIDETLYKGYEGRSGEIGHTTLYPRGVKCDCGNLGCLEQYCSQNAVVKLYQEKMNDKKLELNDLVKGFNNDELVAIEIIEEFAKNLGIGLSSLMGMFGPEIIYLNSSLINQLPVVIEMIEKNLKDTIYSKVPIALSKIYNHASLFGATVMNVQFFLGVEVIKLSEQYKAELMTIK